MPTQAERREATRGKLLAAARRRFAEDGYEATSTEGVLAEAGVSRGALYHHFPTKQDLFAAVFEEVSREAIDRAGARQRPDRSPREALVQGCLAWLEEARRPEVATILLDQGPQVLGWQRARDLEAAYSLGLMMRGVAAAERAGEIRVDSVELTARLLNAVLAELALAHRDPTLGVDPDQAEQAVRQLVQGLESLA